MSSTNRGAERQPDDWYETQPATIRAILPHILHPNTKRVVEPCAGRGAIMVALRDHPRGETALELDITGIEIDADRGTIARCRGFEVTLGDAGDVSNWPAERVDLAISNPPFFLAMEILEVALKRATTVAMLLRLNWLGSQDRAPFHRANPSDVYILQRRPSFAASLKCGAKQCTWKKTQPLEDARPKICPTCGDKVKVTTSDSCEYAWFVWGPGRGNRWSILDVVEST